MADHLVYEKETDSTSIRGLCKGRWLPKMRGNQETAVIKCPLCGEVIYLTDHMIDENGVVYPAVLCNHCTWMAWMRLDGWFR